MQIWFFSLLVFFLGCGGCDDEPTTSEDGPRTRLIFIGVDGLDPRLLRGLLDSEPENFPALNRLVDEGFMMDLGVDSELMVSPILWTSMFTGYAEEQHGVAGWTMAENRPVDQQTVRATRFWEAASQDGRSILQVGSLMTSPVVPLNGINVGDSFVRASFSPNSPDLTHHVYPAELVDVVEELVPSADWLLEHPVLGYQLDTLGPGVHPLATDETNVRIFERLWPDAEADIGVVYIKGLDRIGHLADPGSESSERDNDFGEAEAFLPRGAQWIGDYYGYVDTLIARILTDIDPTTTTVIIASDHGFDVLNEVSEWESRHRDPGVLIGWGKLANADSIPATVNQMDLGVTLFALANLPPGADARGRLLVELFELNGAPQPQGSWVLNEHLPLAVPESGQSLDDERTQELQTLGYIEASGEERIDRRRSQP